MLSRVAERLYWLARYLERAENTARMIREHSSLIFDLPESLDLTWEHLLVITGQMEGFKALGETPSENAIMKFLLMDTQNPSSLTSSITQARENMRTTRDIMPEEAWEMVNQLYLMVKSKSGVFHRRRQRLDFLNQVIEKIQMFNGMLIGTLSYNNSYAMMKLGRNLERADMSTRLLENGVLILKNNQDPALKTFEHLLWVNVLKSVSGYLMFRQEYSTHMNEVTVRQFIIENANFPRSVNHCIAAAKDAAERLPHPEPVVNAFKSLSRTLNTAEQQAEIAEIHSFMDDLQSVIAQVHQAVYQNWFSLDHARLTDSNVPLSL